MPRFAHIAVFLPGLLLAAISGCGGGPPKQDVSGIFTYNDQPVANTQVAFIPEADQTDVKPAHGQTDANGRYTVRTYVKPGQEVKGAMVGKFKVTLTEVIAENRIVEYDELTKREESFPPQYADATTTPLTATVSADGENIFNFTLEPATP